MPSRKATILKDTALYAAANYVAQGIGMINSFLLRRFMGPAGMGVWSVIQVIQSYCGYASLGTTRALARDYPLLRGQKKFDEADLLRNSTLTFAMSMSAIPAILLLAFVFLRKDPLEHAFGIGLLFLSGFLFVQRFYDFLLTLLRSEKEFTVLGKQIVLNATGGILITLFFVKPWQIYGLYLGTGILTIALVFFLSWVHPYVFKWRWHPETLLKELKLGLPLAACSFLYTFLLGLDKLLLAKKLGFYEVGLYSIATMASNYIMSLPMMFSNVLYPNLLELYGEKKEDPSQVIHYLEKPVFVLSILVPFLCALAFAFFPVLVGLFLKKFVGGLDCMKIYLSGAFFLLVGQFSTNFLVTIDKYLRVLPVVVGAIAINYFANRAWIEAGWGVNGVAMGTALSFAFYGLLTYFMALKEVLGAPEAFRRIAANLLVFGSFFTIIFVLDRWVKEGSMFHIATVKGLLFLSISLPYLIYIEKKEHLLTAVKDMLQKKFFPAR